MAKYCAGKIKRSQHYHVNLRRKLNSIALEQERAAKKILNERDLIFYYKVLVGNNKNNVSLLVSRYV